MQPDLHTLTLAARGRAANALTSFGSSQMGGSRFDFLVSTATIDEIVRCTWPPDFIKIDVEGAERLVLAGAQETLRSHRPLVLFEASRDLPDIEKIFRACHYDLFDPTRLPLGEPVASCLFNTLAVPAEKVDMVRQGVPVQLPNGRSRVRRLRAPSGRGSFRLSPPWMQSSSPSWLRPCLA
jgi:hypothetical protein